MFLTELHPSRLHCADYRPAIDYVESAEAYEIHIDMPGVDPESLELILTNNELTMKGERPAPDADERTFHLRERTWGSFERTFTFPTQVADIQAESKLGVLTVRVAKAPEGIARKIPISFVK